MKFYKFLQSKFALVAILAIVLWLTAGFTGQCGKSRTQKENDQFERLPIELKQPYFQHKYQTPKGVNLTTVNPIPEEKKDAVFARVDRGLDSLFLSTEGLGYLSWNKHADFYVMMRPPMLRSSRTGCPLLAMKSGLTVAGTVISFFGVIVEPPIIAVPESFNESEVCDQQLEDGVRFEGEHIKAKYGDINLFNARLGEYDIHPIYELPAKKNASVEEETALAARYADFSCQIPTTPESDKETPKLNWLDLLPN